MVHSDSFQESERYLTEDQSPWITLNCPPPALEDDRCPTAPSLFWTTMELHLVVQDRDLFDPFVCPCFLFPDCTPPLPGCLLMTCIALYLAPIQDQRQYACEEKGT